MNTSKKKPNPGNSWQGSVWLQHCRHAKAKGRASASQKPEPNENKGAQLVCFEAKWNI